MQGCDPYGFVLIVYLAEIWADLILRNHVHHIAHFPLREFCGGITVQYGNLAVIDFVDILREIPCFNGKQFAVCRRAQNGRGEQHAQKIYHAQAERQGKHPLHSPEPCGAVCIRRAQECCLEQCPEVDNQSNRNHCHEKAPAFVGMDVQGGQVVIIHARPDD